MQWFFETQKDSRKMPSISSTDVCINNKEKLLEFEPVIIPKTMKDWGDENKGKAFKIQDQSGQWYGYNRKLTRFYVTNEGKTSFIHSYLSLVSDDNFVYFMSNGDRVEFSLAINERQKLKIMINGYTVCYSITHFQMEHVWIEPLSPEELASYTILQQ